MPAPLLAFFETVSMRWWMGITLNVSGVRLSMGAVVRLMWQAHRHGHTLAITPINGKIIIVPKFRNVHR